MANKKIIETRLGKREVEMDKVITFPNGLLGFEDKKKFVLLPIRSDAPFLVLQCLEQPLFGLVVADPFSFMDKYEINLSDVEFAVLQTIKKEELAALVTVQVPPGKPEETALSLTGPILVNHTLNIGMQVPQPDKDPDKLFLKDVTVKKQ